MAPLPHDDKLRTSADPSFQRYLDVYGRPPTTGDLERLETIRTLLSLRLPARARRHAARLVTRW
jgi:hypothetical protein